MVARTFATLAILLPVAMAGAVSLESRAGGPNYIFSFGDTFTSTEFNPNGVLPNSQNPIGNPAFPGYATPTHITNWLGYLAGTFNSSQIFTYNYAVRGSTIDQDLVSSWTSAFKDQVSTFLSKAGTKPAATPWKSNNALFSVWFGNFDIGSTVGLRDDSFFSKTLLDAYFTNVERLYAVGARNFLFSTVIPLERTPFADQVYDAAGKAKEKATIQLFNTNLKSRINAFKTQKGDANVYVWDSNAQINTILDNLSAYGFTSKGGATLPGLFFGDIYYPGDEASRLFAKQIADQVLAGTIW